MGRASSVTTKPPVASSARLAGSSQRPPPVAITAPSTLRGITGGGAFAGTEAGFAVLLEDGGDRAAGLALDLVVEVERAPAETLGDVGREHRLPGRAEADQHDPAQVGGQFRG